MTNVVEKVLGPLLEGFRLEQPTDYFKDKADNVDIVCSTKNEVQYLMSVLEFFGLPHDYLYGNGQWDSWTREAADGKDKKKKQGKKPADASKGKGKFNAAALRNKAGVTVELAKRPTHFDLIPFQKAMKKFLSVGAEERSKVRTLFADKATAVRNVFKDSHGEISFKKVMDVHEMASHLPEAGINLD